MYVKHQKISRYYKKERKQETGKLEGDFQVGNIYFEWIYNVLDKNDASQSFESTVYVNQQLADNFVDFIIWWSDIHFQKVSVQTNERLAGFADELKGHSLERMSFVGLLHCLQHILIDPKG